MGALSNLGLCSQPSMLAAAQCVHMLRDAATFFGVPPFEDDYLAWQVKWVQCFQGLEQR
jgi:hypothetical protein